jgi:tetratricopeptide (TPR) repeat protein
MVMDSLAASERVIRRWIAAQPDASRPYDVLADVLRLQGRTREARAATEQAIARGLPARDAWTRLFTVAYHAEEYALADSITEAHLHTGTPAERWDAASYLAISQRAQGRFEDALRTLAIGREAFASRSSERLATRGLLELRGATLVEAGRQAEALAALDSATRMRDEREAPASLSRSLTYNLMIQSLARYRLGDTSALPRLADSIQALTRARPAERSRELSNYPRALLSLRRGQAEAAAAMLRQIPASPITGAPMIPFALGEAFVAAGRPRDAVAALQPLLRAYEAGPLLRTSFHEALAEAWDAAGRPDSARVHWEAVARAWQRADPSLAERRARAMARLAVR